MTSPVLNTDIYTGHRGAVLLGPGLSAMSDVDAAAFASAAGITNTTQRNAVNQLVLDLKSASLWAKMHAIYPFVGGTASSHSYNLKNTAQFQITWTNSAAGQHTANGITANGSMYGNTGYTPATSATSNSTHISAYSRTLGQDNLEIGCQVSGGGRMSFGISYSAIGGNYLSDHYDDTGVNRINTAVPTSTQGLFTDTRTTSTAHNSYRNGAAAFGSDVSTAAGFAGLTQPIYILGRNENGGIGNLCSARNLAFATIGLGLSAAEVASLYTAVQTFQTSLGRQV